MIEGQEDVTWDAWRAIAAVCEDGGLEGLFRSDHYRSVMGRSERGSLDAWATLAGLSALTARIRLGTLVSPATFRHPSVLAKNVVTAVRRDTGEKRELPREGLPDRLRSVLDLMQIAMWDRAEKLLKDNTFTITSLEDARDGFNRMGWCGKDSCGKAISEKTGMNVLGTPFYPEPFEGTCIISGEATKQVIYAAKAY